MAVIFAVVGGVAVIGGGIAAYDDHSDWSEYSDWHEYSDAVERKRRRIAAMQQETRAAARDLSDHKKTTVNPQLTDATLRQAPAMTVSETAMDSNAKKAIDQEVEKETDTAIQTDQQRLEEIDLLLKRIQEIEKEENRYGS